jgi:hypothetical protein
MGIAWAWPDVWFLPGFAERGTVADAGAGLLPGERLLWTGRPARARVILGDLILPGLLLAALLAALTLGGPRGPADAPGGLAEQVVAGAAALAGLIATAMRA